MTAIKGKQAARYALLCLALAAMLPLTAEAATRVYPPHADEYYAYYQQKRTVGPVVSRGDVNIRDPYHLPESYNYDWPYGLGLSH